MIRNNGAATTAVPGRKSAAYNEGVVKFFMIAATFWVLFGFLVGLLLALQLT
jgi:cbb3-type cytochrome oxidase subunit 1